MNILLANDDGIDARGIHELADALKGLGDLYISAPDSQRSASGHGITVSQPITVTETSFPGATGAFRMSGTPADCVKLGVKLLQKEGIKIDMVFSGINHGGNLGTDTLYSGTVSAALEGTICGIQSVAVSVNSHEVKTFEYAKILARRTCENVAGKLSTDIALNINVPNLPPEEVKGIKYARLGNREYKEFFSPIEEGSGYAKYRYTGDPVIYEGLPDTIDVIAMQDGYATITPLHRDLTDYNLLKEMEKWRIEK